MALVLDKGATILASQRFSDYENAPADGQNVFNQGRAKVLPLIRGTNLANITIRGEGTIDGAGAPWWKRFRDERAAGVPAQGQARKEGQRADSALAAFASSRETFPHQEITP